MFACAHAAKPWARFTTAGYLKAGSGAACVKTDSWMCHVCQSKASKVFHLLMSVPKQREPAGRSVRQKMAAVSPRGGWVGRRIVSVSGIICDNPFRSHQRNGRPSRRRVSASQLSFLLNRSRTLALAPCWVRLAVSRRES